MWSYEVINRINSAASLQCSSVNFSGSAGFCSASFGSNLRIICIMNDNDCLDVR